MRTMHEARNISARGGVAALEQSRLEGLHGKPRSSECQVSTLQRQDDFESASKAIIWASSLIGSEWLPVRRVFLSFPRVTKLVAQRGLVMIMGHSSRIGNPSTKSRACAHVLSLYSTSCMLCATLIPRSWRWGSVFSPTPCVVAKDGTRHSLECSPAADQHYYGIFNQHT